MICQARLVGWVERNPSREVIGTAFDWLRCAQFIKKRFFSRHRTFTATARGDMLTLLEHFYFLTYRNDSAPGPAEYYVGFNRARRAAPYHIANQVESFQMRTLGLATVAVASLTINVANAQAGPNIRDMQERQTVYEQFRRLPLALADGCGGFGSSVVAWVEESAANFSASGARFSAGYDARIAVERNVEMKLQDAYKELVRQQGNFGNRPAYYPPNVIVPGANFRYGMEFLDAQAFRTCFPKLVKLMTDTESRVAAERKAEAERPAARAEREREEVAVRDTVRREAAAEAARRQAEAEAEEVTPHGQVRRAYSLYILLRWCHDVREGYWTQYVSDVEMQRVETALKATMQRVHTALKAIVTKWKQQEPDMDTDRLWAEAHKPLRVDQTINTFWCRAWYDQLLAMSPVPAIRIEKPD